MNHSELFAASPVDPVDAAPETRVFAHLIDGALETSTSTFDVINPSTGRAFARCPDASRAQFDAAVTAARRAFAGWSRTSFEERRERLNRFADAIEQRVEPLARVLTLEQGKPLAKARIEIRRAVGIIRHLVTIAIEPETLREDASGRVELRHKPLGVVGGIAPWNVPIVLAAPKITSALYTGNTMVLKPSPYTPLTTLMIGAIAREFFPAGVLNVLAGGNELGQWMTEHPGIDKITFTGSVATGKRVMASAATNMKRVTLELGGNDAAIVLGDVDVKAVARPLFDAAFANSGQICQAIKRLYVHTSIYDALVDELADIARRVPVGDGFDEQVELGPVQNRMQYERVLELIDDTVRQPGVRIVAGGRAIARDGYFIEPTIVADIAEGTRLVDEEPFGPVLPVLRFDDIEEVLGRANASPFGLGGSVWTRDVERGAELAARMETGVAWVNHHLGVPPEFPFGGVKESGIGRANGEMGLKRNMEPQLVVVPAR
ncbi:aldehyde dehydrogenase family protein [Paraburkholderia sp. ZP32-5]|uniref:aldehyde dehydrogenase family protein n=1 Tax=Paraburkholderia sp. ZP32-5 TaxID=2883245 RepID=UPI001F2293BE|nr:aldehyde dehydrogenase family protein [Paraburkholderia sp. ZP32-5]